MNENRFVTYEEFGAVGDGVTNDFPAIREAHNYANENGLTVKATPGKTYYISDTRIDGKVESATVKTDVVWTGADFIIDDSLYSTHENYGMYPKAIFNIESDYDKIKVVDEALFEKILASGLNRETKKIDMGLGYPAMIIPYNSKHTIYRRRGYGRQSAGAIMHEVILLDKDGNVDEETPVMFDYDGIDYIEVVRADVKPITVEGGKFTTVACNTSCVVRDESGEIVEVREPYISRNLNVKRSHTTIKGVEHYVTGEISINRQKNGEIGPPYRGFFYAIGATNVTFEDCVMTGRRCYDKRWISRSGTKGTYGLSANTVNKLVFKNCYQSNFWITLDENNEIHPAKEGDEGALLGLSQMRNDDGCEARMFWGIGGSNFCKNMEYIGCTLSRFDAHEGLCNGKIIDSTVVAVALVGKGKMYIENSRIFSSTHALNGNVFFTLRSDYGSIWEGDIITKGLKAYVYTKCSSLQNATKSEYKGISCIGHTYNNWYYGYECYFPNIELDELELYDIETNLPVPKGTEVIYATGNMRQEPRLHLENTLRTHPLYLDVDEDGDGFVDGTKIPFDDVYSAGGVLDESSYKNINPIVPPKYFRAKNNKNKYVFLVNDMSSLEGVSDGGFFGKTEFVSDDETYVGTSHSEKETKTFKFIKLS